jgi:hypothetical protein
MHVTNFLTRFVCCGQLRRLSFQVTLVRDSGQIRALRASARLHHFFVRTVFLFTGEVIYCLIVKTHFKRPSLCDYQFTIIRIQFFETRTSSCHNFKEAKANGGSPQLSSPSYSPIIVPFRRVGGNLVMKLTHKGDRERPSKSLGSGEHLATLRSHWTLTDGLPA